MNISKPPLWSGRANTTVEAGWGIAVRAIDVQASFEILSGKLRPAAIEAV
jgi:hypothetical protein